MFDRLRAWWAMRRLRRLLQKELARPDGVERLKQALTALGYKRYTDASDPENEVFFGPNGERFQIKEEK